MLFLKRVDGVSKDGRLPFIHRGRVEKKMNRLNQKNVSLIHSGIDRKLIIIFKKNKKKKKVIKRNFFFLDFLSQSSCHLWADSNLSSCLTLSALHIFLFWRVNLSGWLGGRLICRLREPWPFLSSDNQLLAYIMTFCLARWWYYLRKVGSYGC